MAFISQHETIVLIPIHFAVTPGATLDVVIDGDGNNYDDLQMP
jgi:hypothetical protein